MQQVRLPLPNCLRLLDPRTLPAALLCYAQLLQLPPVLKQLGGPQGAEVVEAPYWPSSDRTSSASEHHLASSHPLPLELSAYSTTVPESLGGCKTRIPVYSVLDGHQLPQTNDALPQPQKTSIGGAAAAADVAGAVGATVAASVVVVADSDAMSAVDVAVVLVDVAVLSVAEAAVVENPADAEVAVLASQRE